MMMVNPANNVAANALAIQKKYESAAKDQIIEMDE
jgi:hypothetical protein